MDGVDEVSSASMENDLDGSVGTQRAQLLLKCCFEVVLVDRRMTLSSCGPVRLGFPRRPLEGRWENMSEDVV